MAIYIVDSPIDYMTKIKIYPIYISSPFVEIFDSGYFNKIKGCWTSTGLKECAKQCGSFDKLNEQFVEKKEYE